MTNAQPTQEKEQLSLLEKFLRGFAKVGNLLPTPFMIFTFLFALVAVISAFVSGSNAIDPASGEEIVVLNFLSTDGLHWFMSNLVKNFTSYAPLGVVLVMTMGIGLCEEVGFLTHGIKKMMKNMPLRALPYFCIMIGIIGQVASDSAQILIPPLAGAIYLAAGRNPIVGVLTAFSGCGLGYLANPLITTTDVLTTGITNSVLEGFMPDLVLDVLCNYYFKVATFLFLALIMGLISDKYLEPRWGKYTGKALGTVDETLHEIETPAQKRGMRWAGIATLLFVALLAVGCFIPGMLLDAETGLIGSPLLSGIVPVIFALLMVCGLAYGFGSGALKGEASISKTLGKQLATMGGYLAMAFMAAQFTSVFNWTKMGTVLSIKGAEALAHSGFVGAPLFIAFIILVVLLDYLITSSSAKWTVMAPIFVPMLAYLGYHPAFVQTTYRIGDAGANILGPTNVFLWILLDICQKKYDDNLKIGNFLSSLFVFFIVSQIGFIILMCIWMALGLPVGPGSPVHLA